MGHGLLRWSLQPNITSIARLLADVTGLVNQELLLKNEYLLAENRILKTPYVKKLDLLESNHSCGCRTIPGKAFQKDVTQRYTVHI
jgi:hypothetical protein